MRYNYLGAITSAAPLSYENIFRGNSIYDPSYTFTVGEPSAQGHHEWGTFYTMYQVLGCKITVTVFPHPDNITSPQIVCIIPEASLTGTPANMSAISTANLEYTLGAKYGIVGYANGGKAFTKVKHYMSAKKMFALQNGNLDQTISPWNANPSLQFFYHVLVRPLVVNNESAQGTINVRMTYYVKCNKRNIAITPTLGTLGPLEPLDTDGFP